MGDLAQFMVQNELDEHSLVERAGQLNFPQRCLMADPCQKKEYPDLVILTQRHLMLGSLAIQASLQRQCIQLLLIILVICLEPKI